MSYASLIPVIAKWHAGTTVPGLLLAVLAHYVAVTSTVQRASGTRTPLDVLLRALWIKRRTTAHDLDDYAKGVALRVTCLIREPDAGPKSIPTGGSLLLKQGDQVGWWPSAEGGGISVPAPLTVASRADSRFGPYVGFELGTAAGTVIAFIPRADVALVKHVMEAQGSWNA